MLEIKQNVTNEECLQWTKWWTQHGQEKYHQIWIQISKKSQTRMEKEWKSDRVSSRLKIRQSVDRHSVWFPNRLDTLSDFRPFFPGFTPGVASLKTVAGPAGQSKPGWCTRSGPQPRPTKAWIEGWLSIDRSHKAALLLTKPWPRIRSYASGLTPSPS